MEENQLASAKPEPLHQFQTGSLVKASEQPPSVSGPHSKFPSATYHVPAPPFSLLRTTSPPTSLRKQRPSSMDYLSALPQPPKLTCLSKVLPSLHPALPGDKVPLSLKANPFSPEPWPHPPSFVPSLQENPASLHQSITICFCDSLKQGTSLLTSPLPLLIHSFHVFTSPPSWIYIFSASPLRSRRSPALPNTSSHCLTRHILSH